MPGKKRIFALVMLKRGVILLLLLLPSCIEKVDMDSDILDGTAVCWMGDIPDSTPLSRMSIPGAHDAASATITAWTAWTQTQGRTIAGLWNCGVRAFDLRPALVDGELGIYHDKYSAHVTFQQVMKALLLALEKHPSEGAIILIRHEEEADGNNPLWQQAMGGYLDSIRPHLVAYHSGLTMGELRGKVLILSRNEYKDGPKGAYIKGWSSSAHLQAQKGASLIGEDGKASELWVQDYYHPEGEQDKWEAVKAILDQMEAVGEACPLVINHCSGYLGTLPDYRTNARIINVKTADYLAERSCPAGIVMMDYAGESHSKGVYVGGDRLVSVLIGR